MVIMGQVHKTPVIYSSPIVWFVFCVSEKKVSSFMVGNVKKLFFNPIIKSLNLGTNSSWLLEVN